MTNKFTQEQLNDIMEQSLVRQCACPSLLTRLLSDARYLQQFQENCLNESETDQRIHAAIAHTTEVVSAQLEECLIEVLAIEGWQADAKGALKIPALLLRLQMEALSGEAEYSVSPDCPTYRHTPRTPPA